MKIEWGYNKVVKGAGVFGADLHLGYGIVTCECGQQMNVHEYGKPACVKCGLHCSLVNGKIVVEKNHGY